MKVVSRAGSVRTPSGVLLLSSLYRHVTRDRARQKARVPMGYRRLRFSGAAILVLAMAPAIAMACTCAQMQSTCDVSWSRGAVIFLGRVTAKNLVPDPRNNAQYQYTGRVEVHFSVSEIFRGPAPAGDELVVLTGLGGGDCGYPFVTGQSYLVYATTHENQLATSICSETRAEAMTTGALPQLRAIRDQRKPAVLFGTIVTTPRGVSYEDPETRALSRVRVRAIGSTEQEYSTTSDEQGSYSFAWLPPDKYRLEIDLPAGLSRWQRNRGQPLLVEIGSTDQSRGCRTDVLAKADGRISGVIVDTAGKPVAGFVTVKPADPAEAEAAARRGGLPGFTTDDGKFSLEQIPPGRYVLYFYPKVNGQVSFIRGASRSEAIDLAFGQHVEDFQFKVTLSPESH